MLFKITKLVVSVIFTVLILNSIAIAEKIKKIEFIGNDRIPDETILMFSKVAVGDTIDDRTINKILKNLYESNFFKNVNIKLVENSLKITVVENPLIEKINYNGIKAKKNIEAITENLALKPRSSYNDTIAKQDLIQIKSTLRDLGYFFATVEFFVEDLNDNRINLNYEFNLGKKSKIKKIKFVGKKKYKDSKLKNIIISEEYKFWKFISGRKYLNENLIEFDKRLLKNFYLNKGYFNVEINSSYAQLVEDDGFELTYNINSNEKIYFNDLKLNIPSDFNNENFDKIKKIFYNLKGEPYSLNDVHDILE